MTSKMTSKGIANKGALNKPLVLTDIQIDIWGRFGVFGFKSHDRFSVITLRPHRPAIP